MGQRKFQQSQDRAALTMAARNAESALRHNKDSVSAMLSSALVNVFSGQIQVAMDELQSAVEADPGVRWLSFVMHRGQGEVSYLCI